MRKLCLLLLLVSICTSYTFAEISLRMNGDEEVVVITSDEMEKALFFPELVSDPADTDEENDITTGEDESAETETFRAQGKIPNIPFISTHAGDYATENSIISADLEDAFDEIKGKIIVDVMAVNWKTGYNITVRDKTFWQRLKYVLGQCSVAASSIPAMSMFGMMIPQETIQKGVNAGAQEFEKAVECAFYDMKLKKELRFTLEGLYFEIVTKNPFLLLTLNDTVYEALEKKEKEILASTGKTEDDRLLGVLVKNMESFFDLRAKFGLVSDDYQNNTEKLYKISKKGAGDAWSTFKLLNDYSLRMNNALQQNTLSASFEGKGLLSLKKTIMAVGEDAKTNHSVVSALRKDSANKELVERVDSQYSHVRKRKRDAKNNAENAEQNDKELLLRAYKKK